MKATLNYSATIAQRLAAGRAEAPSGCLEWQKARLPSGYGRIGRGSRGMGWELTHRVAWELENGPIPTGMQVCHACDNPPCSNVGHLFLGTQGENLADMVSKGRQNNARGESHHSARLSDEDVAELRRLAPTVNNHAALGRMFGISKQHARAICLGRKRAL